MIKLSFYWTIVSNLAIVMVNLPHSQCKQVPDGAKLHSHIMRYSPEVAVKQYELEEFVCVQE